jgi:hypothetical protein
MARGAVGISSDSASTISLRLRMSSAPRIPLRERPPGCFNSTLVRRTAGLTQTCYFFGTRGKLRFGVCRERLESAQLRLGRRDPQRPLN